MENNEVSPKVITKIKSKIYDRYNWSAIGVCIQVLIATVIATAMQIVTYIILVSRDRSLLEGGAMSIASATKDYNMVFTAAAYIVANTVTAVIVMKASKTGRIRDYITKPAIGISDIILACIALLGVSCFDDLIMKGISFVFGSSTEALGELLGNGIFSDNIIIKIISIGYIALIGPITEEILLRGCALPVTSHISPRCGIFCSALLFGLMHGNLSQIFNAFILGLILAYVTLKSRSLIPAMLMHITNNSAAVISSFIENGMDSASADRFSIISNAVTAALGIAALIILIKRNGIIDEKKDTLKINLPVPQESIDLVVTPDNKMTFKTFFASWALWLVILYAAFASFIMIILGQALGG